MNKDRYAQIRRIAHERIARRGKLPNDGTWVRFASPEELIESLRRQGDASHGARPPD